MESRNRFSFNENSRGSTAGMRIWHQRSSGLDTTLCWLSKPHTQQGQAKKCPSNYATDVLPPTPCGISLRSKSLVFSHEFTPILLAPQTLPYPEKFLSLKSRVRHCYLWATTQQASMFKMLLSTKIKPSVMRTPLSPAFRDRGRQISKFQAS